MYINDIVGKCNRLDKCGYHYPPRQYYENNPRLRDKECSFVQYHMENEQVNTEHLKLLREGCSFVHYHRGNEQVNTEHPRQVIGLPEWFMLLSEHTDHTTKKSPVPRPITASKHQGI